jgi:hypothetical protein
MSSRLSAPNSTIDTPAMRKPELTVGASKRGMTP